MSILSGCLIPHQSTPGASDAESVLTKTWIYFGIAAVVSCAGCSDTVSKGERWQLGDGPTSADSTPEDTNSVELKLNARDQVQRVLSYPGTDHAEATPTMHFDLGALGMALGDGYPTGVRLELPGVRAGRCSPHPGIALEGVSDQEGLVSIESPAQLNIRASAEPSVNRVELVGTFRPADPPAGQPPYSSQSCGTDLGELPSYDITVEFEVHSTAVETIDIHRSPLCRDAERPIALAGTALDGFRYRAVGADGTMHFLNAEPAGGLTVSTNAGSLSRTEGVAGLRSIVLPRQAARVQFRDGEEVVDQIDVLGWEDVDMPVGAKRIASYGQRLPVETTPADVPGEQVLTDLISVSNTDRPMRNGEHTCTSLSTARYDVVVRTPQICESYQFRREDYPDSPINPVRDKVVRLKGSGTCEFDVVAPSRDGEMIVIDTFAHRFTHVEQLIRKQANR